MEKKTSKNELSRRLLDLQRRVGTEHRSLDRIAARIEEKGRREEDGRLLAERYRSIRALRHEVMEEIGKFKNSKGRDEDIDTYVRNLDNEERLNAIFSRSAGKREDLLGWMDGDTAKVTVPWFIKAEAREVLKDYTEMLNGRYTNIRFQDANGWKTSALIEFEAGRAKLSPEVCSMIITGAKAEEIVERITRKLSEERKCEKKEAVREERAPGKKKGKGI